MKISEMKDERALDCCAEIIEPLAVILADGEVAGLLRAGQYLKAVKPAIRNHKAQVTAILAAMDGTAPQDYHPGVMSLPVKLYELFTDKELTDLFSWQAQKAASDASGSAMGNITGTES